MPKFTYEPKSFNDKSVLNPGMHPGFLLAIQDEAVPEGWMMAQKSARMWRWVFAVYQQVGDIQAGAKPERQSATSSQTFSPGGKYQPSKAYVWTCKLLGRKVNAGESIDLDPMLPLPCQVSISRTKSDGSPMEYANIKDIEQWPDGTQYLTPGLKGQLATLLENHDSESQAPVAAPAYAQPAQPPAPAQSWATPAQQPVAATNGARRW